MLASPRPARRFGMFENDSEILSAPARITTDSSASSCHITLSRSYLRVHALNAQMHEELTRCPLHQHPTTRQPKLRRFSRPPRVRHILSYPQYDLRAHRLRLQKGKKQRKYWFRVSLLFFTSLVTTRLVTKAVQRPNRARAGPCNSAHEEDASSTQVALAAHAPCDRSSPPQNTLPCPPVIRWPRAPPGAAATGPPALRAPAATWRRPGRRERASACRGSRRRSAPLRRERRSFVRGSDDADAAATEHRNITEQTNTATAMRLGRRGPVLTVACPLVHSHLAVLADRHRKAGGGENPPHDHLRATSHL